MGCVITLDDEEIERREKRNSIIRAILICCVLGFSILLLTGIISFDTLNVPELPPKPELQLRWDEFP